MSPQDFQDDMIKRAAQRRAERQAAAKGKKHVVASGETLSHLSQKYYGSAAKPYWMVIYEANKTAIGDNPNRIREGMELVIPELPADLKKG